ncbi:hypothetical protein PR202_gb22661 [Eleusine coracana subsp. coracana]|uniref:NAC domain-containing protein n=1 Tax=Eleusine coracana subsp. coracana TaxID=191504 RepID=A0AAV5FH97_ELECO|nr:hypothetical protein PR202_gb22661 [Eleusine coracana subsp. coracana]
MGTDHRRDPACTGLLPPGFRFRPTDEELLVHYLARKAVDAGFAPGAISDVDIYKAEPWDLLLPAAAGGGDDNDGCRYFFCARRVRFPSGVRTNRATRAGYWKSMGKDKVVVPRHGHDEAEGGVPLGVKKTLVFYKGRAPRGEKTGWVMHEYRMVPGNASCCSQTFARGDHQIEWVLCRMFRKKPPPPGEVGQVQETILQPPCCGDHLQTPTDEKMPRQPAGSEHPNCFSDGLLHLNHEDLLVTTPGAYDLSSATLLAHQAMLLPDPDDLAANSSFDMHTLPQLLHYEDFPNFVHDF